MNAKLGGFKPFGSWILEGTQLTFKALGTDEHHGLFALLADDEVMYVGTCEVSFRHRMDGLRNPPASQQTHYRLAPCIRSALSSSQRVETAILVMPEATRQELKERRDALIRQLSPAWNLRA
ncbi:hypothetical protein [Deinococcus planocerae]|uniref:hypothetical protein n=1 Tax=Deinococcus planocerae TaxID=1737569 RepID=UPI0011AF6669|nr:hypothetical protein [Deinococcus planocerae]